MNSDEITVDIAWAQGDGEGQHITSHRLPAGVTVRDALVASRLGEEFDRVRAGGGALARYGKIVSTEDPLNDGDRVEILRPLIVDAKESRRRRAAIQALRKKSQP